MPESGTYGSVRGAAGNSRPYRECRPIATARQRLGPASESLQGRCYGALSLVIAVTNAAPVITPAEHPHVQAERPQPILFAL